ncbi:hypothetical protein Avbf_13507, partial [Armadillidium vulgare]
PCSPFSIKGESSLDHISLVSTFKQSFDSLICNSKNNHNNSHDCTQILETVSNTTIPILFFLFN